MVSLALVPGMQSSIMLCRRSYPPPDQDYLGMYYEGVSISGVGSAGKKATISRKEAQLNLA
ncbi:hypothetical protein BS47DRAFT_89095 [Hydnum rufescens UP504]|uniref:Uncharacterized protein n=1 Tax=Hydnum rufescens UP504 TaxID=1448309 RepID=A0A9P6AR28_9AGAM|nr:hypothetical protein BS47DRAFT_89095 [Hydnum rufescens UP504]